MAMIATGIVWPFLFSATDTFPSPKPNAPLPAQFSLDQTLTFSGSDGEQFRFYRDDVELKFPIQISGLAAKTLAQLRAAKLDLDLQTGNTGHHIGSRLPQHFIWPDPRWPDIKMKRSVLIASGVACMLRLTLDSMSTNADHYTT